MVCVAVLYTVCLIEDITNIGIIYAQIYNLQFTISVHVFTAFTL